jgi:hypothetical protein
MTEGGVDEVRAARRGAGPRGLPEPAGTATALTLKLASTKVIDGPQAGVHSGLGR